MRKTITFLERFETRGGVAFEPGDEVIGVKRASFDCFYEDSLPSYWSCFSPRLGRNVSISSSRSNLFTLGEVKLLLKGGKRST